MKRASLELYQFQKDGVDTMVHALLHATYMDARRNIRLGRAFLLHDEMGLGKTVQTWETLRRLNQGNHLGKRPTLVVGPASALESVWVQGDNKHFGEFSMVQGIVDPRKLTQHHIVVVSYELLLSSYKYYVYQQMQKGRMSNEELIRYCVMNNLHVDSLMGMAGDDLRRALFQLARGIPRAETSAFRPGIFEFWQQEWACLILDEVHRIKNAASATTRAVGFLAAHFRIALSGTPIMNSGNDLLNILKYGLGLVDLDWTAIKSNPNGPYTLQITQTFMLGREKQNLPEMEPVLSKRQRADEIVVISWQDHVQKARYIEAKQSSLAALDAMDKLCGPHLTERRRQLSQTFMARLQRMRQICLHRDLPYYVQEQPVPELSIHWTAATHKAFGLWTRQRASLLFRILRLRTPLFRDLCYRIVSAFVWSERHLIEPSSKMMQVMPYLHEKFIVFCTFRVFLEHIMQPWLDQIGIRSTLFVGGNKKRQQEALKAFNEDPQVRAMLIVKSAGAEGLNLQHATGVCIIMDPHFNVALDEQAAQRIDRIGQERQVIVRRLFMEGSIDEAMRIMQNQKTDNVNAWLRNKSTGRTLEIQKEFLRLFDTV